MSDCEHKVSDHDLLLRIDEKVVAVHARMDDFVTRQEFQPVQRIVYGLVTVILVGIVGAIVELLIKK